MTYSECEEYILNIPRFTAKNDLTTVRAALEELLKGRTLPPIIHVAGTNGKGSVCSYISNILISSGLKVGLFTSPHLEKMTERIMINGDQISEDAFVGACMQVRETLGDRYSPTFFEFVFLMAMIAFAEAGPDYIVLETGLGGRLDATNCLEHTRLCVITEIGMDHMQYLGNTYAEIAAEKAGIIKKNSKVVFFNKREEASNVIRRRCGELSATYYEVLKEQIGDITKCELACGGRSMQGISYYLLKNAAGDEAFAKRPIEIAGPALYQTENSAIAINGVLMLEDSRISETAIRRGICNTRWPGRMEELAKGVFADGAHNIDGVEAMLQTVAEMPGEKTLLFAVVSDKQYREMIHLIVEKAIYDNVVITKAGDDRATDVAMIRGIFEEECKKLKVAPPKLFEAANVSEAIERADSIRGDGIVVISGSLYLVGDARQHYH